MSVRGWEGAAAGVLRSARGTAGSSGCRPSVGLSSFNSRGRRVSESVRVHRERAYEQIRLGRGLTADGLAMTPGRFPWHRQIASCEAL